MRASARTNLVISAMVAVSFFLTFPLSLNAQAKPAQRLPHITASHPDWSSAGPQELFAPYWTLEPGWNTELEMRNNIPWHELRMTPVLRTSDGTEVALTPVELKPEEIASINLREAVSSLRPELAGKMGAFGSVTIRFEGTGAANGFAAAVVRREGRPIDFHFDAEGGGSKQFEGMWWLPVESATSYLILSNPSRAPVTGKLFFSDASGAAIKQLTVPVGPGQSIRMNVREELGNPASGTFGGLSLSTEKGGSLSATEIVFDEVSGLATMLKLFNRQQIAEFDKVEGRVLRAPMMALGRPDSSLGFPSGTVLEPRIFLRNAGPAAAEVSPIVNWHNDNQSGSMPLPRIRLRPEQMTLLSLADFQKSGQIPEDAMWATVTLGFTGRSGDLVAVATSYDKTNRYGLQTPFSEGLNHLLQGTMWHVDGTHNTLITAGNGGGEPTKAQVTLFYNGGRDRYRMEKLLSPGEQLWLNVGDAIHNQIPDADGKTIPPDVMLGSYELRDLGHPILGLLYEGKLIVDKTYGHASYGCTHCCGYSRAQLAQTPFSGPPNLDNQDEYQAYNVCDSRWDSFDVAFSPYSSNTGVATLPVSLMLHTVGVGGASTSAKNTIEYQANVDTCQQVDMPGTQRSRCSRRSRALVPRADWSETA